MDLDKNYCGCSVAEDINPYPVELMRMVRHHDVILINDKCLACGFFPWKFQTQEAYQEWKEIIKIQSSPKGKNS